jgi:hypothetical protein
MLLVLMEEEEESRELLLMTIAQYRSLRSWFRSGGSVGEVQIYCREELVRQVRLLIQALPSSPT